MSIKLLLYHMRYFPDKTGTAPLVTQLCQDLVGKGVEVTVITSLPHYGRNSIHPDYRDYRGFFHHSTEEGVRIIRTPVFVPRSGGILPRALNYLSYNLLSIVAGFLPGKPDVLLAVNPPITTAFSAWIISFLRRAPLLIGIQDVWPDCVIRVGKLKNRLVVWISEILEKTQYLIARKVIVLSRGMKSNLESKGVHSDKIEIIANWADTGAVQPLSKFNDFYREQNLEGYFVVLFSGNHGYISALDNVVRAAALLQEHREILFILAGEGSVKVEVVDLAAQLGLENIRFLPTQPEKTWLEMLAACDLALVPLRKDLAGLNVPSKVYTLMAAARPILASVPEESEVARLVLDAKSGTICRPDDPTDLAEKILAMKADPDLLGEYGRNGRKYLLKNFNRQQQTARYYQLLKSIVVKE